MLISPLPKEKELLLKIARGDHRAFCLIFDKYQKYVFGFGRKLTRSTEQAEDIVQQIFLKIWEGRENLVEVENFEAYLNRLVRNQSFDILRRHQSHARGDAQLKLSVTERDNSMESQMNYKETMKILDEAIQLLPDQQKRVYQLCHQDGLKYNEAASEMNISPDTVHYHMKLALKSIRDHFKRNALAYPVLFAFLFKNIYAR